MSYDLVAMFAQVVIGVLIGLSDAPDLEDYDDWPQLQGTLIAAVQVCTAL